MKLRIGTRGSRLAMWQAERVAASLARVRPDVDTEIVRIDSTGDRDRVTSLASLGTVGIFTREIEAALVERRTDVAVHSLKDMPTEAPVGLRVAALLPRDDPRDVLVSPSLKGFDVEQGASALATLPRGARVGTSSLRRRAELLRNRPDLRIQDIRGNVTTRLKRLEDDLDAIVLSYAGLVRLELTPPGAVPLPMEDMLPAPAQGTIAVQVRADHDAAAECIAQLDHQPTRVTTDVERLLLHHLEGGCRIPLGAHATIRDDQLILHGRLTSPDGRTVLEHRAERSLSDWRALAAEVAETLRARGGTELLHAARGL
jgi:hydroxymethylbilane synthase